MRPASFHLIYFCWWRDLLLSTLSVPSEKCHEKKTWRASKQARAREQSKREEERLGMRCGKSFFGELVWKLFTIGPVNRTPLNVLFSFEFLSRRPCSSGASRHTRVHRRTARAPLATQTSTLARRSQLIDQPIDWSDSMQSSFYGRVIHFPIRTTSVRGVP